MKWTEWFRGNNLTVSGVQWCCSEFRVHEEQLVTCCYASCGHFVLLLGYVGSVEHSSLVVTESAKSLNILWNSKVLSKVSFSLKTLEIWEIPWNTLDIRQNLRGFTLEIREIPSWVTLDCDTSFSDSISEYLWFPSSSTEGYTLSLSKPRIRHLMFETIFLWTSLRSGTCVS